MYSYELAVYDHNNRLDYTGCANFKAAEISYNNYKKTYPEHKIRFNHSTVKFVQKRRAEINYLPHLGLVSLLILAVVLG